MINSFKIGVIIGVGIFLASCGLIPIPHPRTLPGQITSIEILDSETAEPIPHVKIVCSYEKFKNWLPAFPPRIRNEFCDNPAHVLTLSLQPNGRFVVQEKRVAAYIRPFGISPLGTTIFEDYTVTISANAPHYLPCALTYYPHEAPMGTHHWENGTVTDLSEEGRFRLYLDKQTAVPITSIDVVDLNTRERIVQAEVKYASKRLSVWGNTIPLYATNTYLESGEREFPLSRRLDGTFGVEPGSISSERRVLDVMPDGETLYEVDARIISTKAPGYIPFSLGYYPPAKPLGRKTWQTGNVTSLTNTGELTIYLRAHDEDET